jgi:Ca-activated chloride channel family protein
MSKAAQFGRGSYTYIGKIDEVDEKMSQLFRKIQHPVLSNIQVHWPDNTRVEMWPQRLPDLYAGEPLMLIARLSDQNGSVTIKGERAQQQWQVSLPLKSKQSSPGVAILWAREKIASLMDHLREGAAADIIKKAVTDVALRYQLVSRYTSLVAVDVTPSRLQHDPLVTKATKVNLPAGWEHGKVFNSMPQTATDSLWNLLVGFLLIVLGCLLSLNFQRRSVREA